MCESASSSCAEVRGLPSSSGAGERESDRRDRRCLRRFFAVVITATNRSSITRATGGAALIEESRDTSTLVKETFKLAVIVV